MSEAEPDGGKGTKSKDLKCVLQKSEIPIYLRCPGLPYSVFEAARAKLTGERFREINLSTEEAVGVLAKKRRKTNVTPGSVDMTEEKKSERK